MESVSDKVWDEMVSVISERNKLWESTVDLRDSISYAIKDDKKKRAANGDEVVSGTVVVENNVKTTFGREFIDNHIVVDYYDCDGESVVEGGSHPHYKLYNVLGFIKWPNIHINRKPSFRAIRKYFAEIFCDFQGTLSNEYVNEPIVEKCKNILDAVHSENLYPELCDLALAEGFDRTNYYGFNTTSQIVKLPVYNDVIAIREYLDDNAENSESPLVKYVTDVYWDFLFNISRINVESVWYYSDNYFLIKFPRREMPADSGLPIFENEKTV